MSGSEPCRYEDMILMQDLREINRLDRVDVEQDLGESPVRQNTSKGCSKDGFFKFKIVTFLFIIVNYSLE